MKILEEFSEYRLLIHAGLPKTGTSALQRQLYDHRADLEAVGIAYDTRVKSPQDPKHQWIADCLRKPELLDDDHLRNLATHRRVILSTESISNEVPFFEKQNIEKFVNSIKHIGPAYLMVVLREKNDWERSYYKQIIINDRSRWAPHYRASFLFSQFRDTDVGSLLTNHERLVSVLSDLFSMPVIRIPYEKVTVSDIIQDITGLDLGQNLQESDVNPSLSDTAAEIMRQLNGVMEGTSEKLAWSRLFWLAGFGGNAVLDTLASRTDNSSVATLSISKLFALRPTLNPPLKVVDGEFVEVVSQLSATLEQLARNNEDSSIRSST